MNQMLRVVMNINKMHEGAVHKIAIECLRIHMNALKCEHFNINLVRLREKL